MYRNANNGQSSIYDFILPFGGEKHYGFIMNTLMYYN